MFLSTPAPSTVVSELTDRIDQQLGILRHRLAGPPAPWMPALRKLSTARLLQSTLAMAEIRVSMADALDAIDGISDPSRSPPAALDGAHLACAYISEAARDPGLSFDRQLTKSIQFLLASDDLSKCPGRFRPGFHASCDPRVVHPDALEVDRCMASALASASDAGTGPAAGRAARLHRSVLLIRPFASANGRVARALRALLLGRASGLEPVFVAIDEAMATPPQDSGPDLADESDWLAWELQLQIRQGVTVARRTDELAALWDAIADLATAERLNPRSTTPLFEAALGVVLTNARYMRIAGTETHTATRDFKLLVGRGLLAPLGEKRGRAYRATPRLADLRAATRRPPPPDPT